MAFWFGDSFDLYAAPADALNGYWDSGSAAGVIVTGRFSGSRGWTYNTASATTAVLLKNSGSNDAAHHLLLAINNTVALTAGNNYSWFTLSDGATAQCSIVFRGDGAILLTSGASNGTILATYTGAITATNTWFAFEIEVVINNTTGSFTVRKNGNTSNDFTLGSLNTRGGTANNYANRLTLGGTTASNAQYIDDLLWRSDASSVPWVGDIRCFTRRPLTDASVQWTPSGSTVPQVPVYTQPLSPQTISSTNAYYIPFQAVADGTIGSVTITLTTASTANIKCSFFNSSTPSAAGGVPTTVLGSATAPISAPGIGNSAFTFSPPLAVTRGTWYFLAFRADTASGQWNTSGASFGLVSGTVSYAAFPSANPTSLNAGASPYCSFALTPTSAANAPFVSEPQQDAASSYVYSSTVGQADLYGIDGIASTPTSILAVVTRAFAQKSDAGTRNVAVQIRSAGATYEGASTALNTTWGWIAKTDLVDPATGAAWTPTAVNNAQIGVVLKA